MVRPQPLGVFANCYFYLIGWETESKARRLGNHLQSNGGNICAVPSDMKVVPANDTAFAVVPSTFDTSNIPPSLSQLPAVTDWWVERCLEAECCLPLSEQKLDQPFPHDPIEGFEKLTISSTGFAGIELLHLGRAVRCTGATYDETFHAQSSVLICNRANPARVEKLRLAGEFDIPVVDFSWLLDCILQQRRRPFKPYLIRTKRHSGALLDGSRSASVTASESGGSRHASARPRSIADPEIYLEEVALRRMSTSGANQRVKQQPEVMAGPFMLEEEEDEEEEEGGRNASPQDEGMDAANGLDAVGASETNHDREADEAPSEEPSGVSQPAAVAEGITPVVLEAPRSPKPVAHKPTAPQAPPVAPKRSDEEVQSKPQRRKPTRILGRAPSNVSVLSREGSVDSTASRGAAVQWPRTTSGASDNLRSLQDVDEAEESLNRQGSSESQMPQTQQLGYQDEEGQEYRAQMLAKISGEAVERRPMARAMTLGETESLAGGRALRKR
jgi:DNA replication regulator DPB11